MDNKRVESCSICSKSDVCKYKESFSSINKANMQDAYMVFTKETANNKSITSTVNVSNLNFIEVVLKCKYFCG